MAYVSLYRKWRPSTFEEVIGQKYVTRTLANSLRAGNFSHAYLFTGPRGTGKTSTARILAKALNCEEGPTPNPCNHCLSCRSISEGTSMDVIEIDAASNRGIDDIRDLRERIIFSPAAARMKVYILDEAHMLTLQAFNALLKMLEEPPAHVVFVLATTEPHKMPPTILSRCQRFDFRSVAVPQLVEHLHRIASEEGVEATDAALRLIARRARGSARDALVIFEQVISYGDGEVGEDAVAGFLGLIEDETLLELGESLAAGNAAAAMRLVERAYDEGRDLAQFAREIQEHFRKVFLLQFCDLSAEDLEVDEATCRGLQSQAKSFTPTRVVHFIQTLRETAKEMQSASSPRLLLEEALVLMARKELDTSPQALSARTEALEAEVERLLRRGVAPVPQGPPPVARLEVESITSKEPAETETAYKPEAATGEEHGDVRPETEAFPSEPDSGRLDSMGAESETAEPEADTIAPLDEDEAETGGVEPEPEGTMPNAEPRATEPPQAAGAIDLAALRRAWPKVKERVKEKKVTTHAFLLEGKPSAIDRGELTISFGEGHSFHKGELEKDDHKKVLEQALEEVLGVELKVRSIIEDEQPRQAGEARESEVREKPTPKPRLRPEGQVGQTNQAGALPEPEWERPVSAPEKAPMHDAGKVKLVKDIFGAEMIEEIKLNE